MSDSRTLPIELRQITGCAFFKIKMTSIVLMERRKGDLKGMLIGCLIGEATGGNDAGRQDEGNCQSRCW
jgi:hypothetical protein